MYPKIEAEPLKTHSQAEPGNERFSKLSRLMFVAETNSKCFKDYISSLKKPETVNR